MDNDSKSRLYNGEKTISSINSAKKTGQLCVKTNSWITVWSW